MEATTIPTAQVPTLIVTVAARVPTPTVIVPVNHEERQEKFSGLNFKRWQQKMMFYLTTLNLARFLTEDPPKENEEDRDSLMAFKVWKILDYLCRNYVLNSLTDPLYNVYSMKKLAKELWESLDKKHKTKDVGTKKLVVGRFLDYKMVD